MAAQLVNPGTRKDKRVNMKFTSLFILLVASLKAYASTTTTEENLKTIELGKHFPSVGMIVSRKDESVLDGSFSAGSGSLIDHEELGFSDEYKGRIFLTCAHGLIDKIKKDGFQLTNYSVYFQTHPSQTYLYNYEVFNPSAIFYANEFKFDTEEKEKSLFFSYRSANERKEILPSPSDGDIAFIILDRPVPLPVFKLQNTYNGPGALFGTTVTSVGYGCTSLFTRNIEIFDGFKRAGHNIINYTPQFYPFEFGTVCYKEGFVNTNPYRFDSCFFYSSLKHGFSTFSNLEREESEALRTIPTIVSSLNDTEPYTHYLANARVVTHCTNKEIGDYFFIILKPLLPLLTRPGSSGGPVLIHDPQNNQWTLVGIQAQATKSAKKE